MNKIKNIGMTIEEGNKNKRWN